MSSPSQPPASVTADQPPTGATAGRTIRALGIFSVLCIGVNAIVGSGIYRLPGRISHELGGASWIAFALTGLLLITIGLCFAEMGSMFDATGGPYVYAREAFGKKFAFVVGWMAFVTMVFSWAAVANAVLGYLPAVITESKTISHLTVAALVIGPGALNYFGVKPGAYATNFFTVAKLVPLAAFVLLGIAHVNWTLIKVDVGTSTSGGMAPLGAALFAALFACQGFEVAPIPAGETANPKKAVPIAVIGSLVGCSILYVLIQIVAFGTRPEIAQGVPGAAQPWSAKPLADAAVTFMGSPGASLMAVGACISMMGYCVGTALATPRFLEVFADDGLFPKWLGALHKRFKSPDRAIVATTIVTLVASQLLDFDKLVDLANVAVTLQYAATCAAVTVLRFTKPSVPRGYRVPLATFGAFLWPILGIGVCIMFITQAGASEFLYSGVAVVAGIVLALASRFFSARAQTL